jgi:NADH dehydrogenase
MAGAAGGPARIVLVGGGYAGFVFARTLERLLPPSTADISLVSPTDYMLYTSLLPQVVAGNVEPRHLAVALRRTLRRTRIEIGEATSIDLAGRRLTVAGPEGDERELEWDRLVLAPGAVTRWLDIPGVREHAFELKTLPDAVRLRDHITRALEEAEVERDPRDRAALSTFVVVGGGYTGTELAAQAQHTMQRAQRRHPRLRGGDIRWLLLDVATGLLPGLDPRLGTAAHEILTRRGVDVRLGTSVTRVDDDSVTLTDGSVLPCRTLVWTAGVMAHPLVHSLGLPTTRGRLTVDAQFRVPGSHDVFAFGDAAAVPDLTQPEGALAGQTAQHAIREGRAAAINVAASLGVGAAKDYRHSDLGFVVDLGGTTSVANPLHVALRGPLAAAVARGYHLIALPTTGNRARVLTDWALDLALGPQLVGLDSNRRP